MTLEVATSISDVSVAFVCGCWQKSFAEAIGCNWYRSTTVPIMFFGASERTGVGGKRLGGTRDVSSADGCGFPDSMYIYHSQCTSVWTF